MQSLEIQIKKEVIIGVYEREKKVTQPITIDIYLQLKDNNKLLNQNTILDIVNNHHKPVELIEHLAYVLGEEILKKFTNALLLKIDIKKPMAIKNADYAGCSVLFELTEDISKIHQ